MQQELPIGSVINYQGLPWKTLSPLTIETATDQIQEQWASGGKKRWEGKTDDEKKLIMQKVREAKGDGFRVDLGEMNRKYAKDLEQVRKEAVAALPPMEIAQSIQEPVAREIAIEAIKQVSKIADPTLNGSGISLSDIFKNLKEKNK